MKNTAMTHKKETTKVVKTIIENPDVRIVEEVNIERKVFQRNLGIIKQEEQQRIRNARVAVAGVGGDGGMLVERLARLGVGSIKITDPGEFDESNINRQYGSSLGNINRNKAQVIKNEINRIMGKLCNIDVVPDGINEFNVESFVRDVDIVVDEIEYSNLELSVMLHRAARKYNKYVFLSVNVAWGANMFIFSPTGMTLEEYCGLNVDATIEEVKNYVLPLDRFCPNPPEYIDPKVIQDVLAGKDIPSVSPAISIVASLLATEIALFILGNKNRNVPIVPDCIELDLYQRSFNVRTNH